MATGGCGGGTTGGANVHDADAGRSTDKYQAMAHMTIYKEFTFDSAHKLTRVPAGHKCATMHGHTYRLIVSIHGEPDDRGMLIDYAELAAAMEPILKQVDHQTLNDIHGLENPTTEVLAPWLWRRIHAALPDHKMSVEVKESSTTGCIYNGPRK